MSTPEQALQREIYIAFWKVHVLHHASEHPICGNWMLKELRTHGYDASPGTLYPLLARLAGYGWLSCEVDGVGPRARRLYRLTPSGHDVLAAIRAQLHELAGEVDVGSAHPCK